MKKIFPLIVIGAVIIAVYLIFFRVEKIDDVERTLFLSDQCKHCQGLEDYIDDNNIDKKLNLKIKNISKDSKAKDDLSEKAVQCGVGADRISIPFLWNGDGCNIGDTNIIKYFEIQTKEKK